ncbi:unnamed protein product [Trichobilharzia szidati]|nr:unnamed protein product [Trichobilharzia szidati]CAH8870473.1 unnamed protein product [Trichobilharzia szidati]
MSNLQFACNVCNVRCDTENVLRLHEQGKRHRLKCLSLQKSNSTLLGGGDSMSIFYRCEHCEAIVFSSAMQEHLNSEEHKLGIAKIHGSSVIGFDHILPLREYRRSCQEVLCPVWPSVKFTDAEANLLMEAAKNDDDCILLLSSCDGRSRVGLHLANALLIANRHFPPSNNFGSALKPSTSTTPTDITCVLWIAPEKPMTTATNRSTFIFQPGGEKSSTGRPLIFAYPPFDPSVLSETDIVRTNSGGFITHLAWLLMQQKFLCGIIIEDVEIVSKDVEFCQLLTCFLKVYSRQANRGRIICFNESKVEPGSIFSSFAQYE